MSWKLRALLLAGPILLFPFARSYNLFLFALLVLGLAEAGPRGLWRESPPLRLAAAALGLPILLTTLAWGLQGSFHPEGLSKALLVGIAATMAMATARQFGEERVAELAALLITIAIVSWSVDGVLQLLTGHSIACRGPDSACVTDDRLSLYWARKTKVGYYIGMFSLMPAAWLLARGRRLAAVAVLALAGLVVLASDSRFSLLAYLLGVLVFAAVSLRSINPRLRAVALAGIPAAMAAAGVVFYQFNESVQRRVHQVSQLFDGMHYDSLNQALSGRLYIWEPTVQVIRDHWLFGVGPERLGSVIRAYMRPDNAYYDIKVFHAHQVILDIWAATGLVGVLAFLAFYAWVAREFLRETARGLSLRWAALLVFLLMWFPINSGHGFYSSEPLLVTFFMLGIGFGLRPAVPAGEGGGAAGPATDRTAAPSGKVVV